MIRLISLPAALALVAAAPPPALPPAPLQSTVDGLPIGALPQQDLPAKGCAAFFWTGGNTHALVAVANADPAQLRLSIGGTVTDFARAAQQGIGGFGFAGVTEYQAGEVKATLDMTITTRPDLKDGAAASATLAIDRPGQDGIVVPLGGLIACT